MQRLLSLALAAAVAGCVTSHGTDDAGTDAGLTRCGRPSECVVVPASCCGRCGQPTRGDAVAVNSSAAGLYRASVCDGAPCPACAGQPDPTLAATCGAAAVCAVVDLQTEPMTACTTSSDCRVRAAACCECGATIAPGAVVAVRADSVASYEALVCDPGTGCTDCIPAYTGWTATCDSGRCAAHGPT